jgi:hypothetical protein
LQTSKPSVKASAAGRSIWILFFGFFLRLNRNTLLLFWRPLFVLLIFIDIRLEHNVDIEFHFVLLEIDPLLSHNKKVGYFHLPELANFPKLLLFR